MIISGEVAFKYLFLVDFIQKGLIHKLEFCGKIWKVINVLGIVKDGSNNYRTGAHLGAEGQIELVWRDRRWDGKICMGKRIRREIREEKLKEAWYEIPWLWAPSSVTNSDKFHAWLRRPNIFRSQKCIHKNPNNKILHLPKAIQSVFLDFELDDCNGLFWMDLKQR